MNHPWHDIDPGSPENPVAFVEIPRDTRTKYELDKKSGLMLVNRVLFSSFVYPFNYGFVPQTLSQDDDPVDCFVMGEELLPMTLVQIHPVGMIQMTDEGETDNKILAAPCRDPRFETVRDLSDITPHYLREIEHFLSHYKDLEHKRTVVTEWVDRAAAVDEIRQGIASYRRQADKGRWKR